ncbi:hypothetical protein REJC140_01866 [Pseudorhizobium endolithicum]|uniref:Uncharacterized protein n=1 Tax=Pseudorhizobium endolithicum TaxID=1191678 RepID=A0ABM8PWL7_9HYPH|nr:hypothetical protein [Pseudorhizobium endolithicum]CAD7052404.1 hypothetical protein REJC140_01866 [Pseudorhizobium endolithicum]
MTDRSRASSGKDERQPASGSKDPAGTDLPVKPVENFDLGKVEKDRRIFQNGDTDRTTEQD